LQPDTDKIADGEREGVLRIPAYPNHKFLPMSVLHCWAREFHQNVDDLSHLSELLPG